MNSLFLSCRFEAERDGPYNEYVYNFFRCLSMERMEYAEGYYSERRPSASSASAAATRSSGGARTCKADLARFGTVEDGDPHLHDARVAFELATGRCLTSDDRRLFSEPLEVAAEQ